MRPPQPIGATQDAWDAAAIVLAFALPLVVLRPLADVPFVDDWVYAWSVQHLLATGRLELLEWSSNWNPAQVVWGALFCLPGGFSFSALRLSTWALGAAGLVGLQRLLRELGVAREPALLGTATLACHPLWIVLSFTFMTDVPFAAVSIWAALAAVRALRSGRVRALAAAVALATVACAIRLVGVVLPVALAASIVAHREPWDRRHGGRGVPLAALVALAPLAVVAADLLFGRALVVSPIDVSSIPSAPTMRWALLPWAIPAAPRTLPVGAAFAATFVGVALLPLTAGSVDSRIRRRALGLGAAVAALFAACDALAALAPPLFGNATWTIAELGATAPLVAGYEAPAVPAWAWLAAIAASLSAGVWLAWVARRPRDAARAFLALLLLGHVGLIVLLWLFYDRYGLVLIAPAIALLLAAGARPRRGVAIALAGAMALAGLGGVRDHLALSRALWGGVAWLREHGASPSEIDGGYVVNGWVQYAHPENAPRDAIGRPFVPDLTVSRGELRYQLALRPLDGWRVLARLPFERRLAPDGEILVLERERPDAVSPAAR